MNPSDIAGGDEEGVVIVPLDWAENMLRLGDAPLEQHDGSVSAFDRGKLALGNDFEAWMGAAYCESLRGSETSIAVSI